MELKNKFAGILIAILTFTSFNYTFANESAPSSYKGQKRKFVVSAYYSPLPGQSRYLRGNYEAEIRLNGRGTNGADGNEVFMGMIAAPKNYDFGTKIEIPGLGIGTVHDRGGAIIARDNSDRIDIWMGYGEEGLARALQWGMRTVEGTIINNSNAPNTLSYANIPLAKISSLPVANFTKPLAKENKGDEVRNLQIALADLGYLDVEPTGFFGDETQKAVLVFQLANNVIATKNSAGAGVFGPKTKATLASVIHKEQLERARKEQVFARLFPVGMQNGTESNDVKRLQIALKDLGFYNGDFTDFYGNETEKAVLAFQLANSVISTKNDPGAGYFGPKTHKTLIKIVNDKREKMLAFEPKTKAAIYEGTNTKTKEKAITQVVASNNRPQVKAKIFEKPLKYGDRGEAVKELQNILAQSGFLDEELKTGFYGSMTHEAVVKFQIQNGVIASEDDFGAGVVGPKTSSVLVLNL